MRMTAVSEQERARMVRGKVKWFSDQKGYGFIAREEAPDVFVHHTAIEMEGFRTLRQGEDVLYEMRDSVKGPQAAKVTRAEAEALASAAVSGAIPVDNASEALHAGSFAESGEEQLRDEG